MAYNRAEAEAEALSAIKDYGVDCATLDALEAALVRLGATRVRRSSGHNQNVYELPNGKSIITGAIRSVDRREPVHSGHVRGILKELHLAGVPVDLYLALVEGLKWKEPHAHVDYLKSWLEDNEPNDLTTVESWAKISHRARASRFGLDPAKARPRDDGAGLFYRAGKLSEAQKMLNIPDGKHMTYEKAGGMFIKHLGRLKHIVQSSPLAQTTELFRGMVLMMEKYEKTADPEAHQILASYLDLPEIMDILYADSPGNLERARLQAESEVADELPPTFWQEPVADEPGPVMVEVTPELAEAVKAKQAEAEPPVGITEVIRDVFDLPLGVLVSPYTVVYTRLHSILNKHSDDPFKAELMRDGLMFYQAKGSTTSIRLVGDARERVGLLAVDILADIEQGRRPQTKTQEEPVTRTAPQNAVDVQDTLVKSLPHPQSVTPELLMRFCKLAEMQPVMEGWEIQPLDTLWKVIEVLEFREATR